MNKISKITLAIAVLAGTTGFAQAQAQDNPSWYIMPSIGVSDPDDGFNGGKNAPGVGLKFGKQISPSLDLQLGGTFSRDRSNGNRYEQGQLGVDALYMFKRGNVRPFALIGAGAQRDRIRNTNLGETSPYVQLGGGVQVALSDQWFAQADVRRTRANVRGSSFAIDHAYTNSANIGFAYYFDKPAPAPVRAQFVPPPAPQPIVQAPPPPPPPAPVPPPAPQFERITLSATELFAFDSANLRMPQTKLDELARALTSAGGNETITITGYTDRLGSEAYNQKLSQQRADSVKNYLTSKGVSAARLNAQGKGESNPVVQCDQKNRAALIQCLEPNRRVEVEQIVIERRVN